MKCDSDSDSLLVLVILPIGFPISTLALYPASLTIPQAKGGVNSGAYPYKSEQQKHIHTSPNNRSIQKQWRNIGEARSTAIK